MRNKLKLTVLAMWYLLSANTTFAYTHADTLRGSNGRGRAWWDVMKYDLSVMIDTEKHELNGRNKITFNVTEAPADSMQIDLQDSLKIFRVECEGRNLEFEREGNAWWIKNRFHEWMPGSSHTITVVYAGQPRKAVNPPWDGGFTWTHDSLGNSWIAVSCQGLGASAWWPCKDAQWDEPDSGMTMTFSMTYFYKPGYKRANDRLSIISNGRQEIDTAKGDPDDDEDIFWTWHVVNPINNYDMTLYIGDYVHWHDTLMGEKGKLDLDYWVLRYNEARARKQFAVVKQMIHCFEYWMGPYPFYEDGYKLVEAPYLGMEHQSAVAYGNKFQMGYRGFDRSATGYGMAWDYIIVHESGHEWFGNNVTAKDEADNWIHEGITSYSEGLFTECLMNKEKGKKYTRGLWSHIENEQPVIGPYSMNKEGEDIYEKGAAIMYMIRELTNDDEKFRTMLRGLGKEFYHQTVTTAQVEQYIARQTGLDLTAFFEQYLRQAKPPQLEYVIKDNELSFHFNNAVPGFSIPVTVTGDDKTAEIHPTAGWQKVKWTGGYNVKFSHDFLMKVKS